MWYSPLAFSVGKRDVIGAWLLCLVVAAAFFGWTAATHPSAADHAVVAAAAHIHHSTGKCA